MAGFWGYSHARISSRNPRSLGRCDRCAWVCNREDLQFQYYWRGKTLENTNFLVCRDCLDVPNEQTRVIILPPDPVPILNPRIEDYVTETTNWLVTQDGQALLEETGQAILTQGDLTPDTWTQDYFVTDNELFYFVTEGGDYFVTEATP